MLQEFYELLKPRLEALNGIEGLEIVLYQTEMSMSNGNPSIQVRLESQAYIADLGCWSSKTADFGAVDFSTGEYVVNCAFPFEEVAEVVPYLDKIFSLFLPKR